MLQNTESEAKKFAEGGDVIWRSILHKPLPYVAAINLFDWYCISSSDTITFGKLALLKFDQSVAVLSLINTPRSVPIYKVSVPLFSSSTIVLIGIFGKVPE